MFDYNPFLEKFSLILEQKSPRTKIVYLSILKNFLQYYSKNLKKKSFEELAKDDLLMFFKQKNTALVEKSKDWEKKRERTSKKTNALLLSALTKFYHYLEHFKQEETIKDLRREFLGKISHSMQPISLNPEEVKKLIKTPCAEQDKFNERNELLIMLLFTTGMRADEASNLKIDDLGLEKPETKIISITGKGSKIRRIKLDGIFLKEYKKYKLAFRSDTNPYVFINKNGSKLSTNSIWKIVKRKSGLAELSRNGITISPHKLRSTFATSIKKEDILVRQALMGHSSPATTSLYTLIDEKDLIGIETPSLKEVLRKKE